MPPDFSSKAVLDGDEEQMWVFEIKIKEFQSTNEKSVLDGNGSLWCRFSDKGRKMMSLG